MSGWSTFFTLVGVLFLVMVVPSLLTMNIGVIIALVMASLSFFAASSLFDAINRIEKTQKEIMKRLDWKKEE